MEVGIVGYTFDWDNFDKAKAERWEKTKTGLYHCTMHNTYFDPIGSYTDAYMDAEPCWSCYDEFNIKIG